MMHTLQDANNLTLFLVSNRGYDGRLFVAKIVRKARTPPVTVKHLRKRVEALAKASTHRAKFTAKGGTHLTLNDMSKPMEADVREKEVKEVEKEKEQCVKKADWMAKGKAALSRVDGDYPKLKANELVALLRWYGVPPAEVGKKEDNYLRWLEICGDDDPEDDSWTESDERAMAELMQKETTMADTALGCL